MKQYIGFIRDHSISMTALAKAAARDYNTNIDAVKKASIAHNLDTIVNTVMCGIRGKSGVYGYRNGCVKRDVVNSNVHALKPIPESSYLTNGSSTPLFDAVGELIGLMENVPDANDPNVSFLVIVITDGQENDSRQWNSDKLTEKIKQLQYTDRWTFTFRVPHGGAWPLTRMGIPEGNILEWEQTQHGMEVASEQTHEAVSSYYSMRSQGGTKSTGFFADLRNVTTQDVKQNLVDISSDVAIWPVKNAGSEIRTFVEYYTQGQYLKGAAFYELTKPVTVQDYKGIIIFDKISCLYYGGKAARQLLKLPEFGSVRLRPGDHGHYNIYIQSTSVNRKLIKGTKVVYWPGAVLGNR